LKSIDLVCMKKLDTKVNIIPIIAKADTISKTELQKFKVSVMKYHIHKPVWYFLVLSSVSFAIPHICCVPEVLFCRPWIKSRCGVMEKKILCYSLFGVLTDIYQLFQALFEEF